MYALLLCCAHTLVLLEAEMSRDCLRLVKQFSAGFLRWKQTPLLWLIYKYFFYNCVFCKICFAKWRLWRLTRWRSWDFWLAPVVIAMANSAQVATLCLLFSSGSYHDRIVQAYELLRPTGKSYFGNLFGLKERKCFCTSCSVKAKVRWSYLSTFWFLLLHPCYMTNN